MSALAPEQRAFLHERVIGALATRSAAGDVHVSAVYYALAGEEIVISTEASRHKARDVEASAWAALCVIGEERPFPSLTVSGTARVVRTGIGAATASVAQRILGLDEPPEAQSDEALAGVGRVIIALQVEHAGPASYLG